MNKKFTMMLAAFMAAGYTMTVEAGVVKFENPENGVVAYAQLRAANPIESVNNNAFTIGDKYLTIVEGQVVLKNIVEYATMGTPTTWTGETGGYLKSGDQYLQITANGPKLVAEKTNASKFNVSEELLTVVNDPENTMYVTSDLKLTNIQTKGSKYTSETLTDIVPTLEFANAYENSIPSLAGNFRLVAYASGANFQFLTSKDGIVKAEGTAATNENAYTSADADKKKTFYWTYSDGIIKNGTSLVYTSKVYPVWVEKDDEVKAFYLINEAGSYLKLDATNGGFSAVGATGSPTVFSALGEATTPYAAANFVDDVQGEFSVTYKLGETVAENNLFTDVTPIYLDEAKGKYGTGLYFVVDAPAGTETEASWDEEKLDKLTFVTVSPKDKYLTHAEDADITAKFEAKKGEDLIAVATSGKKDKTTTANACFSIAKSDLNPENMIFTLPAVYVNDGDNLKKVESLTVAAAKVLKGEEESGTQVVVTVVKNGTTLENSTIASFGSENIVTAANFLSTSDAKIFNIQFLSQKIDDEDVSKSEYLKYLSIGNNSGKTAVLAGSKYVDLSAAQSQWIVTNMADDVVTFTNLEDATLSFSTKLVKTENANEYRLTSVTDFSGDVDVMYVDKTTEEIAFAADKSISNNMTVKLTPVTFDASAGYVSDEFDKAGLVKLSFTIENNINSAELFLYNTTGTTKIELNNSKSSKFELVKLSGDGSTLANEVSYAYLKDGAVKTDKKVKTELNKFAIKLNGSEETDGKANYLNYNLVSVSSSKQTLDDAKKFLIKKNYNGSYDLIKIDAATTIAGALNNGTYDLNSSANVNSTMQNVYEIDNRTAYFQIVSTALNSSLEAKSQHVMFQSGNTYMAVGEEGKAIMAATSELKAEYTKEDLTFWLDTTDAKAVVPTFYISKGSKQFLFNAIDSTEVINESTGSVVINEDMVLQENNSLTDKYNARAIFRAGELKEKNTVLSTTIDGKAKDLKAEDGIEAYQYTITLKDEASEGEYIVRSNKDGKYLYRLNSELGFTANPEAALVLTVSPAEAPTSNEAVTASEVKVVAQDGAVVIKNAAGKNVVVSTILGQVVANEVLTSDNATINVPAGIVVVAVEGESFKVNVK